MQKDDFAYFRYHFKWDSENFLGYLKHKETTKQRKQIIFFTIFEMKIYDHIMVDNLG